MSANKQGLTPVGQALDTILQTIAPRPHTTEVTLQEALGRVLMQGQHARIDVPAHDNSAMDGFAVNTGDLQGLRGEPPALPVSQTIAAGHPGQALTPGSAARIFTGAAIPAGADAVVIQEDTRFTGDRVEILQRPRAGENIRSRGHDIQQGSEVLGAGHRLQPQDLGLLASLGIARIAVARPLKVAIINTGDEVVPLDQALQAGQIYDSNSFTLAGLLHKLGCEVHKGGIIQDDLAGTVQALEQAADQVDCIITTGGVSVGDEDHVRAAVQQLGELSLWKLAIKPGKPFSFGRIKDVPFFGLPGNPVAVFVTFVILVRPCLLKLQGAAKLDLPAYRVAADFALARPSNRDEYVRVRLQPDADGSPSLKLFPNQGSSILTSLSWADGLALVPAGSTVTEGEPLQYLPFNALL